MSKKVIRIISFVLVVVTLLGFIIPYVSATELETDTEITEPVVEVVPEDGSTSKYGTPPEGFELIESHDTYRVEKTNNNINVWFHIPIDDNTPKVYAVAFIVDIEKNMVVDQITLYGNQTYVNGLKLSDGYYALTSAGYAFSDGTQNYEINGGKPFYFYVGDTYKLDNSKYGVPLHVVDNKVIELTLTTASESATLRDVTQSPIFNSEVVIPEEITKLTQGDINEITPNDKPTNPQPDTPAEPEKPEKPEREFFLITIIKDSWVWLVLLAVAGIAYKILESKKKNQLIKNLEADRNDKGRFE